VTLPPIPITAGRDPLNIISIIKLIQTAVPPLTAVTLVFVKPKTIPPHLASYFYSYLKNKNKNEAKPLTYYFDYYKNNNQNKGNRHSRESE